MGDCSLDSHRACRLGKVQGTGDREWSGWWRCNSIKIDLLTRSGGIVSGAEWMTWDGWMCLWTI